MDAPSVPPPARPPSALERLEALGNRLPDPLVLFAGMAGIVVIASVLLDGATVTHPGTGAPTAVTSLATAAGVRRMFTDAVRNFAGFPPL
ncbi:MAG: AbgT family transporter, partial [Myxococcota bacterium]